MDSVGHSYSFGLNRFVEPGVSVHIWSSHLLHRGLPVSLSVWRADVFKPTPWMCFECCWCIFWSPPVLLATLLFRSYSSSPKLERMKRWDYLLLSLYLPSLSFSISKLPPGPDWLLECCLSFLYSSKKKVKKSWKSWLYKELSPTSRRRDVERHLDHRGLMKAMPVVDKPCTAWKYSQKWNVTGTGEAKAASHLSLFHLFCCLGLTYMYNSLLIHSSLNYSVLFANGNFT